MIQQNTLSFTKNKTLAAGRAAGQFLTGSHVHAQEHLHLRSAM